MPQIVLATHNPHKVEEFQAIVAATHATRSLRARPRANGSGRQIPTSRTSANAHAR